MPSLLLDENPSPVGQGVAVNIHESHFRMLRLAKLRALQFRDMGRGVYRVSSHSRPGHFHKVAAEVCSCEAVGYCSHLALALHARALNEAGVSEYLEYMQAQREDFKELELRILHGEETADDRRYARPAFKRITERLRAESVPVVREAVTF